jgi:hypothetical protein
MDYTGSFKSNYHTIMTMTAPLYFPMWYPLINTHEIKGHFEAYTAECFVFLFFLRTNEYGKKQNKYLNV